MDVNNDGFMSKAVVLAKKPLTLGRPPKSGGELASSHIHMTITCAQKASYVRAAVAEKKKLSEWVTENLDLAANLKIERRSNPST